MIKPARISLLLGILCGACAQAASTARVEIDTSLGPIVVEVDLKHAPISAGEFLRYVDAGLYDGGKFYRVVRADNDRSPVPIDVIQGGLTDANRALPPVPHESTAQTGIRHTDGTISLARRELGSARGSRFFICVGAQPELDFGGKRNPDGQGFAAFGHVVSGMSVVRKIHALPAEPDSGGGATKGQMLRHPVIIEKASRLPAGPVSRASST
jgi:peptidyl-prolyl cis-trans isomerase A (cyclophilin A)